jgi:hypothetical protein
MWLIRLEERMEIMEKEIEKDIEKEVENIVTNPSPTHNTLLTKKTGSNTKKMVAVAIGCFLVGGVAGIGGTLAVERFVVRPHTRAVRMVDADGNYIGRKGRTKKSDGNTQAQSGDTANAPDDGLDDKKTPAGDNKSGQGTNSKSNKARSNRSTDGTPGSNSSGSREDGKARFRDAAKAKRAEKNGQTSPANGTDQTQTTTTGGGANEN